MPASFRDISDAFEFVDMGSSLSERRAFLCRQTGKIYWHSEFSDVHELNDQAAHGCFEFRHFLAIKAACCCGSRAVMVQNPANGRSAWLVPVVTGRFFPIVSRSEQTRASRCG
jgi:hypothetical protein